MVLVLLSPKGSLEGGDSSAARVKRCGLHEPQLH